MEETANRGAEPEVGHVLDGDTARVTVTGELTEAARRPLVQVLTDLLLQEQSLSSSGDGGVATGPGEHSS